MKWNENSQRFRDLIGREELSPPRDRVVALLKEMDEAGQRRMARELQFSFAKRSLKRWPEMIFMKTLREYLQQATHDLDIRQRLYLALIQSILPLLGDEEEALESFMGRHQALIKQYGVWHFYWAFYFHPARMFENELWEGLKPEVEEKCMKLEHSTEVMDARANLMKVVVRSSVSATAQVTDEQSRRIAVEKMLATERERRIQMEHEVSQYQRLLREKQSEGSELGCQLQELQQYAETLVAEGQAIQQQIEQERRERHEALRRVMSEKTSLTEQLQLKRQELKQQEQETEQYELKLAELRSSYDRMRAEAMEREEILHDTGRLLRKLSELLHAEIEQIAIALNMKEQESPEVRTALRRQLRATVDLLDTMELYTHKAITVPDGQSVLNGVSIAETIRNIEDTPRAEVCAVSEAVDQIAEQAGEEVIHIGTFYRREHGGYIQLENQETFNITESMVYKHDLQHQAEVQCRPRTHQSGGIYYDIELLFQGDDAVSPIRQLDGYVELGEHHTWYCVEMNQPLIAIRCIAETSRSRNR
ncbi:hypothetical protein [Paenibacillus sp. JCM 10914]|uniref:hypothetical protein n=1 Tax=Paenibacillus sp. JCM 10914 TaxID=1236974 RepID=UPI000A4FB63A|nr:hypothetical protein [Paenibacillus sp. JCM 10914]